MPVGEEEAVLRGAVPPVRGGGVSGGLKTNCGRTVAGLYGRSLMSRDVRKVCAVPPAAATFLVLFCSPRSYGEFLTVLPVHCVRIVIQRSAWLLVRTAAVGLYLFAIAAAVSVALPMALLLVVLVAGKNDHLICRRARRGP